jgi:branched-chain amino acid aminotransferase
MTPFIQANTNGRLHAADEPSISPLNRGFLYGDAIYEVWRTYHGTIFAWEEHWRRLERSAQALFFSLPFEKGWMLGQIKKTVAAFRQRTGADADVYIRLQIARGNGPIGLDTALADAADFVLLVQENKLYPEAKVRAGLALSWARELRRNSPQALNPAWKTGNYLNNILCLREARMRGADEVVITNLAGEITEAAVSNIAFVRAGKVVTPPLSAGILAGITREIVLGTIAGVEGVAAVEETVRIDDLPKLDECFLLSTTKDITPVASLDDHRFQVGESSLAMRLKRRFAEYAAKYAEAHPELRVD